MVNVSLIICTYNRCSVLESTLRTVADQATSRELLWEAIVVNNNSVDATSQVAARFVTNNRHFRCVFESRQGLSNARNRGIAEASGELLCFIDDDVQLPADYVERAWEAWKNGGWDVAGGRVIADYQVAPSPWVTRLPIQLLNGPFGIHDRGEENFILAQDDDMYPIGANMLIPKRFTDYIGAFNTSLGRSGKSLRSGEDTEFYERSRAALLSIGYCSTCFLRHYVSKNRLTRRYIIRWKFVSSLAGAGEVLPENTVNWFGVPRFFWRNLFETTRTLSLAIFTHRRMEATIRFSSALGTVIGYFTRTRS